MKLVVGINDTEIERWVRAKIAKENPDRVKESYVREQIDRRTWHLLEKQRRGE